MTNDLHFHWTFKWLFLFQVFVEEDFGEAVSSHPKWALSQTWLRKHGPLRRQIAKAWVHWFGGKWECPFDLMLCFLWCDFTNFRQCPHDCTSVACSIEASAMFWRLENLDSECGDVGIGGRKNAHLDSWVHLERFFFKLYLLLQPDS